MPCILVIEDSIEIRLSLSMLLTDNGYDVVEADNPQVAQMMLKDHYISLILLDMNYSLDTTSGGEGLDFLRWMQASQINIATVAMTAWSNVDLAVNAMRLGARDFIEKPWKNQRLLQIIGQLLAFDDLQIQNSKLKQQLADRPKSDYVWRSTCMTQLMQQIQTVATTDAHIFLTGDSGTGKSALASFIHDQSLRKDAPFISVNMGGISESLFESEMFGHIKGAFTDAKSNRMGRFALAETGTLFLDEVANIPLSQQAKLLRVLESGHYEVLGSSQTLQSNIRMIAATNGNIHKLIEEELFREDLYYRLNTIEFNVPALNQRSEDIVPLAQFFITKCCEKYGRAQYQLTDAAKQSLQAYHWPGNLREMSHMIERGVLLGQNQIIDVNDLNLVNNATPSTMPFMTLEAAEIKLIKLALAKTDKNIPKAATLLGLTKASLYRRLEKYDQIQH
jgi:DNA-binding NtrC family response regulator